LASQHKCAHKKTMADVQASNQATSVQYIASCPLLPDDITSSLYTLNDAHCRRPEIHEQPYSYQHTWHWQGEM